MPAIFLPGPGPADRWVGPREVAPLTKHSKFEREKRAKEAERTKQIEAAWYGSMSADASKAFAREVEAARARGPLAPPPDMAPGTAPRPPRPGREPKVVDERATKRRSY